MTTKQDMPELKPCPFLIGDIVEVKTGTSEPSWTGDWVGVRLIICGIEYDFDHNRYDITVAENAMGQYRTDGIYPENLRIISRADLIESIEGLDEALSRSEMWQPSASAKMAYDDYNIFVQAARLYAQGRTQSAVPCDWCGRIGCEITNGDCVEVMESAAPPVTGGAWRPIESAPKDGTKVWLSRNYNNAPVVLAEWSGKTNDWKTGPSLMDRYVSPTHWMVANIPAPPSSAEHDK